ncbi:long-chain fatty acid transport protein [Desulfobotulus alkaliphilus]|uniref:Long-chain fatty acid transport protein n=1 Tax=Desulfobotulus alkaliphilus TaxID=622671 RepID=A0A562RHF7_9BACT|nr:outer membrane protein transport protein [Desulfobotulus alkaliphilus]TWI67790.1 long-chain fatty acid transport protein [Desulfobotulus alkaliphilus]
MKKVFCLCAGLFMLAATAQAGLVQPFGIGARNAALGEAVSAHTTDAFAVYYNPAGLSNIKTPTLSAGTALYDAQAYYRDYKIIDSKNNDRTWDDDLGIRYTSWKTNKDPIINPHIGFAMPVNERISFGIAAYAPYGFHLKTEKDPFRRPTGFNAWESYYTRVAVTPAISYRVNDRLSLGFGVSMGRSESGGGKTSLYDPIQLGILREMEKTGSIQVNKDVLNASGIYQHIDKSEQGGKLITSEMEMNDSINWSWNAGIQYQPTDRLSLGLTYRSRTPGNFRGDFIHNGQTIGTVAMDYDHPEAVQAGMRYAFTERFAMSFDMVWANWSIGKHQAEYVTIHTIPQETSDFMDEIAPMILFKNDTLPDNDPKKIPGLTVDQIKAKLIAGVKETKDMGYRRDWNNKIQYKLAMEYIFNEHFTFLAGYVYDPTPVPADTFDNIWPDNDRHIMTVGTSARVTENWTIDFAFQHIRTFDWGYRDDINGTSEHLNKVASDLLLEKDAKMNIKNKGYLWGYNLTVNYRF